MRFQLQQRFRAPPERVLDAFADPAFYPELARLPKLGEPEVLAREDDGDLVRMQVRYRFTGELSSAARRVIDPKRLTWVDHSTIDRRNLRVTFEMRADHYADRFRCFGSYQLEPLGGGGALRRVDGELTVRVPLVGRSVERAILSGLEQHLDDEVEIVERWVGKG